MLDVIAHYSDPVRHYHNQVHVASMLKLIEEIASDAPDFDELLVATIYHDVIYDPTAKDNEERSAEMAVEILTNLGLSSEFVSTVEAFILCTKSHVIDPAHPSSAIIIDADLAILGATSEGYDEYARAIRKEYSFVSDDDYRAGRTQVLRRFVDRDYIYVTQEFRARYEESARKNIQRELSSLA